MRATVCKRFKFSAAHRLPDYPGPCERVHGHTFHAEVYARGEIGEFGMVVDFGELKRAWAEIEGFFDHAMLNDVLEVPSTENVAALILAKMRARVPKVFRVRLWEGPDQFAEVEAGD